MLFSTGHLSSLRGKTFIQGIKESLRLMREAMGHTGGWGWPELCGNKKLSDINTLPP